MSTSDTKKLLALVSAMNDLSDNMNGNDAKLAVYLRDVTAEGAETCEGSAILSKSDQSRLRMAFRSGSL